MANKSHPCLTLKIRKHPWLQFLHRMALQLIHHPVSLQSPVFTSSTSNNDFGRKGQFSCLFAVHVCLQESNRKGNLVWQKDLAQVHISKNKTFLWRFSMDRTACRTTRTWIRVIKFPSRIPLHREKRENYTPAKNTRYTVWAPPLAKFGNTAVQMWYLM